MLSSSLSDSIKLLPLSRLACFNRSVNNIMFSKKGNYNLFVSYIFGICVDYEINSI